MEWKRKPGKHREIWWCRDGVNDSVSEKCKIWKDSKQGKKNKEKYLEIKRQTNN